MAKNPRVVEPRGGRFDYDIDDRLVGTWFKKGTNGYSGYGYNTPNYWKTHLVFAYNVLDPRSIEISIGSWNGDDTGHQFAVKGNTPDPKEVSVARQEGNGGFWIHRCVRTIRALNHYHLNWLRWIENVRTFV